MRVDDEDVYIPLRHKERSSFEWLGIITLAIVLGTFITDGIRVLAAHAWLIFQFRGGMEKTCGQDKEVSWRY